MTFSRKKQNASLSQRKEFWDSVDMNEYFISDRYREEVDQAWDQHRYLYETRTNAKRTNRED